MIERTIAWCVRNRFFVFLGTACAVIWAVWAMMNVPLDAIPDLSDAQVIVLSEWPGRSPDLVEDQITYPIVSSLIAAPKVKVARGYSFFGASFVYVIFEEGTDIYWARSRVLEYTSNIKGNLPEGVKPILGPDATGVGWIFQYALVDESGNNDLADLRAFQDWYMRYYLESVPGVAEVASIGGFVRQYQVIVDPDALLSYGIALKSVIIGIQRSNNDVGGRVLELAETEHFIRGRGYIRRLSDIENVVVGVSDTGTPVLVKNVARVSFGPDMRRGAGEFNGRGEAVGGIVVMRYGENALRVIDRVKRKIAEVKPALPPGVEIVPVYDRSRLIGRSIATLKKKLFQEMVIVSLVIVLFLWHFRSALVPILTLPLAVLLSFIPMFYQHLTSNIMSLGGIAIAIGALVDASIIMVENAHKRLEEWEAGGRQGGCDDVMLNAAKEIGRPVFFSLLVIAVSFMPVFTLEAQEGRLFRPLAFTKNYSMLFAAILSVTIVPVLIRIFMRPGGGFRRGPTWLTGTLNFVACSRIVREEDHPLSRLLFRLYEPVLRFVLRWRKALVAASIGLVLATLPVYLKLGREFMPPLNEGDILYMPTTLPGISIGKAREWLGIQDRIFMTFPEVETVFGKVGRARTASDPAPLSMVETIVQLKPYESWPKEMRKRWYSDWAPAPLRKVLGLIWPESRRRSWEELIAAMDRAMQIPGTTNAWTMPIKARIDMQTTGIRTPVGIKIFGPDLNTIQAIGERIEGLLSRIQGTRSVFAERVTGGYFIDFHVLRDEIARYGLTVGDVEDVIEMAIGGKNIGSTVEGRERYPINVRYGRELRDDLDELGRVLVSAPSGAQIPLAQLAEMKFATGPPVIKDENGMLTGWVYVDIRESRDIGGYVREAKELLLNELKLPVGYYINWSGQYEYMERARKRLLLVAPLALLVIFILIYVNTGSAVKTGIVLLAIPFSLIGAFLLLYILGYNMSVAVWVGLIALAGIDAETGVVMLLFLDLALLRRFGQGVIEREEDLKEAIVEGAVRRVRPKLMAVLTTALGLLPIMWAGQHEAGADVMKRIAAPMVGGVFTSFLLVLLLYPAIYMLWKWDLPRLWPDRPRENGPLNSS